MFNLRKIILLILFFVIDFFLTTGFYQFFEKRLHFNKSWLIFIGKNILYYSADPNFENKFKKL